MVGLASLNALPTSQAVQPLLMFQGFRYLGAVTLTPAQASGDLPADWAISTAVGDTLTAILALISLTAVRREWKGARTLVWITAIFGLADLFYTFYGAIAQDIPAVAGGLIYGVATTMAPAGVVVLVMLILLLRRDA